LMENLENARGLPKVSVIIPAYNYARFLPGAIQSVLDQTFRDFELIVVDDGSTDDTADVVSPYARRHGVIYIRQENRGLSAARNTGIRHAGGELVAFLDPDDLWLPEKLQRQVALMDANADVGLSYCMVDFIDGEGQRLPELSWPHPEGATYKDLLYLNWVTGSGSSVMVRRSVFDGAGLFDESLRGLEDMDMWLRILRHHKSGHVDEVLARIRRHVKSMQAGKMIDLGKREREYLAHINKSIKLFPELEPYRKEARHRIYEGLVFTAYIYGRKADMLRYYLKAGLLRPSFWLSSIAVYVKKYLFRGKALR
jgi:glycosyltransferase involved in cell wall biosynthesis